MNRLSKREQIMVAAVLGIVFILANLAMLSSLAERRTRLATDLSSKQTLLRSLKAVLADRELGAKRDEWLTAKQPKLGNRDQAGVALLEKVRQSAKANEVLLESPEIGSIEAQPNYQSVSVIIQTKSTWGALVKFLNALQQPEEFVVFETANLQSDSADTAQIRGRFRIAKWYAP